MIIRVLLLWRALLKGSKDGLRNVYLAAFKYFRPEIMRFDRPITIKDFILCTRVKLLIDSPEYEVGQLYKSTIDRHSESLSFCYLGMSSKI